MADYIDREKLLDYIDELFAEGYYVVTSDEIRKIPAADVAPIVRGYWIPTTRPFMNECKDCSVCGYRTWYSSKFNYCPKCGAKMREEDNA